MKINLSDILTIVVIAAIIGIGIYNSDKPKEAPSIYSSGAKYGSGYGPFGSYYD